MKVTLILLALAAVVIADSYDKTHLSWSHVPYYKFDRVVKDDYYNDYGQVETRDGGNIKTNWGVALPGYSHIKRDDVINAQVHHSYSQGYESNPVYKTEYRPIQYKEEYKPVNNARYTPTQKKEAYNKPVYRPEYNPVQYKEESIKPVYNTDYKPMQYKEYRPVNTGYKTEDYKKNY